MKFWRRISRYDPTRRDQRGAFVDETWTSIADVGREYNGVVLTLAEYERIESAYVVAAFDVARACGVHEFAVRLVETRDGLTDGLRMSLPEAEQLLRHMLREEAICKLTSPAKDFVVHVGFDLYMYVGSNCRADEALDRARSSGLFVDDGWPSPQLGSND